MNAGVQGHSKAVTRTPGCRPLAGNRPPLRLQNSQAQVRAPRLSPRKARRSGTRRRPQSFCLQRVNELHSQRGCIPLRALWQLFPSAFKASGSWKRSRAAPAQSPGERQDMRDTQLQTQGSISLTGQRALRELENAQRPFPESEATVLRQKLPPRDQQGGKDGLVSRPQEELSKHHGDNTNDPISSEAKGSFTNTSPNKICGCKIRT